MKAREFWIDQYTNKQDIDDDSETLYCGDALRHKPHTNNEAFLKNLIHVREVLPDEISDTERLEWMINNEAMVSEENRGFSFWCEIKTGNKCRSYNGKTPREAIDAAIREGKNK